MKEILSSFSLEGKSAPVWVREGVKELGSDIDACNEVITRRCYRRARIGFDVNPGEHWLDLGANIGAFAVYCNLRGATADCYEPEPECFRILKKNVGKGFFLHNEAVTARKEKEISFFSSPNPDNHYRGTTLAVQRYKSDGFVKNVWAGLLEQAYFDGIKMDIEGAEGPIIDEWLLPKCEKLVMEYHTSRDSSPEHLRDRLNILEKHFKHVKYPRVYDHMIVEGAPPPRYDQLIFCWGPK